MPLCRFIPYLNKSIPQIWASDQGQYRLQLTKQYIEIITWQFSYHTPYQSETPISARGPKAMALGLIWVSRVDMGYDMKIALSYSIYHTFFFLTLFHLNRWVFLLTTASFFRPFLCEFAEIVTMFPPQVSSRPDDIVLFWQDGGWWLVKRITCLKNRTEQSKARPPSAPNVVIWVFFARVKKPYHPRDLVIRVFCLGKNTVSPTWPNITPFALHKSDMCLKAMLVSHMKNEHNPSKCMINRHISG